MKKNAQIKDNIQIKNLFDITELEKNDLIEVYSEAFAKDKNWREYMKCTNEKNGSICDTPFSEEEIKSIVKGNLENILDKKIINLNGSEKNLDHYICTSCNKPLSLDDYWRDGSAENVYNTAKNLEGFCGVTTILQGTIIGGSWGYKLPDKNTETALFLEVRKNFGDKNINPNTVFYAAENFVHPLFQGKGIGQINSYERLKTAKNCGYEGVTLRTTNEFSKRVLENLMGTENVIAIFNDPDPKKSDRIWYYSSLKHLK